tara:strand:- start:603 stop:785 length:183 start_codon:yes stop_codon:yes gene_type:complete
MRIRESLLWCALSMAKLLALSMAWLLRNLLPYQISHRYIIALLGEWEPVEPVERRGRLSR